jgi:hypothetical protein
MALWLHARCQAHCSAARDSLCLSDSVWWLCLCRRMRDDLQVIRDKTTELEIKLDRVSGHSTLQDNSLQCVSFWHHSTAKACKPC